jgi:hypothetical protein
MRGLTSEERYGVMSGDDCEMSDELVDRLLDRGLIRLREQTEYFDYFEATPAGVLAVRLNDAARGVV